MTLKSLKYREKGAHRQYFAAVVANLPALIWGVAVAWSSPYVPLLMSPDTPLTGTPMTESEVSFMVAAGSFGGLLSTLVCGWLVDSLGRKRTLVLLAVPQTCSWACTYLATTGSLLTLGRVLAGFSGGAAFTTAPVFVSEISDDRRRGTLGSFMSIFCNFGMLLGFVLTSMLEYHIVSVVVGLLSVMYAALALSLAESPAYLEMKGETRKSKESAAFYDLALTPVSPRAGKDASAPLNWRVIRLALVLGLFPAAGGTVAIINFSNSMFNESGSSFPPELASITVAAIQLLGSYVAAVIIEQVGRRTLLMASAFGSSVCLLITGGYYYAKVSGLDVRAFSYVPLVCVSGLFFMTAIGLALVPFVLITEILPQRLRGPLFTLCMTELWGIVILATRFFLPVVSWMGIHTLVWFFATTSLLAGLFSYSCVPETKGKSKCSIASLFDEPSI